jgi:hypothetical protein
MSDPALSLSLSQGLDKPLNEWLTLEERADVAAQNYRFERLSAARRFGGTRWSPVGLRSPSTFGLRQILRMQLILTRNPSHECPNRGADNTTNVLR